MTTEDRPQEKQTPQDTVPRQHRKALRRIESAIRATSPTNRPLVTSVRDHLLNVGRAPGTIAQYCEMLKRLDAAHPGVLVVNVGASQLRAFLSSMRSPSAKTNRALASFLKAALNHAWILEKGEPLPLPMRYAIPLAKVPRQRTYHILTDEDVESLIAAAKEAPSQFRHTFWTEQVQAFLWALNVCGWRIDECLSLRVGDIEFEGPGAVWLRLREDAPALGYGALKTGARPVYVAEDVRRLRAWLDVHPGHGDPAAPLFPSFRPRWRDRPMGYGSVCSTLRRLERISGLPSRKPAGFRLHAHLFRHTAATNKVKKHGWSEYELRKFFGWSADSKEAATYVHMVANDIRDRVRRDHGLDMPTRGVEVRGALSAEFEAMIKERVDAAVRAALTGEPSKP